MLHFSLFEKFSQLENFGLEYQILSKKIGGFIRLIFKPLKLTISTAANLTNIQAQIVWFCGNPFMVSGPINNVAANIISSVKDYMSKSCL